MMDGYWIAGGEVREGRTFTHTHTHLVSWTNNVADRNKELGKQILR